MKKALSIAIGILFAGFVFFGGGDSRLERRAIANQTGTVLMSSQAGPGPGIATVGSSATPGETGSERHSFQFVPSAAGVVVRIEQSNDGATSWTTVHVFDGGSSEWSTPSCGACKFRAWKMELTVATASVYHAVSGIIVPLAPTYTATATSTVTQTPTFTPTRTATSTVTQTPTVTGTPTIDPLSITPTDTPTRTATATPTPTPTRTATATATPTGHTLTVEVNSLGAGANDESVTLTGSVTGTCTHQLTCTFTVPNGGNVTITQTGGSDLGTWSGTGACTGTTATPCAVTTMTVAKTVIWTF